MITYDAFARARNLTIMNNVINLSLINHKTVIELKLVWLFNSR